MNKVKLKILFFLACMCCQLFYSQNLTIDTKTIDSLLKHQYTNLNNNAKFEEAKLLLKEVLRQSKQISYEKGILESSIKLANTECTLKNFDKSLQILDNVQSDIENSKNFYLKVLFYIEYGRNLTESRVDQIEAINKFNHAFEFIPYIKDYREKKSLEAYLLQNLYISHWRANEKRKGIDFLIKSEKIQSDLYNLSCITYYHIHETKNLDSIKHYLTKSSDFIKEKKGYEYETTIIFNQWGRYYQDIKNFDEAIKYYKKSDSLAKKINLTNERIYSLNRLHECYEKLGQFKESLYYLNQYTKLNDSIYDKRRETFDSTVKHIAKKEIEETKFKFKKLIWILLIFLSVLTLILYYISKQKKVKQNIIESQEKIISEIEEDKQLLEKKNEITFDELVQLAKANNVEFFTRFQEAYPAFINKIKKINPDLKVSELTLLAYFYLGFNNKDIAYYTYKSTFTIRNRKHNIRKKLHIESDEDFELYLKSLMKKINNLNF